MIKIPKFILNLNLNKVLVIAGGVALILIIVFWFWWGNKVIDITNSDQAIKENAPLSLITGLPCENKDKRPIAVMISADPITRPLSGISDADMVFEMPVTPSGVTRMMAVFQCSYPSEIGSVRSAREDYIPLAAGLGVVYAHWGGEHEALKELNNHIIDNIDAMVYENTYFYRKSGTPQPHNGFSNITKLEKGAQDLGYSNQNTFVGYPHTTEAQVSNIINLTDTVSIDYPSTFKVQWTYDQNDNVYRRLRGGDPEIDKNNGNQVGASVIAVMKTDSSFTNKDYLTVNTTGQGGLEVYQDGIKISGYWKKDPSSLDSKLFFYDTDNNEIKFAPGKIWVEIVVN